MPRYMPIARPRAAYWDDSLGDLVVNPETVTVFEGDDAPVSTGLVDVHGVTLYRLSDRAPIGIQPPPKRRRKR